MVLATILTVPVGGSIRTARNLPEAALTTAVNPPPAHSTSNSFRPPASVIVMADPNGTLVSPDADGDRLHAYQFPEWSHLRRCQLSFEGVGGVIFGERA